MYYQNILLIDDDEDDHEIFRMAIEEVSRSVKFHALTNCKMALQKLASLELKSDIIFLDLRRGFTGEFDFLSEIKKMDFLKSIPIVIYSTFLDKKSIDDARYHGIEHLVTKPNKLTDLVDILRDVLGKKRDARGS